MAAPSIPEGVSMASLAKAISELEKRLKIVERDMVTEDDLHTINEMANTFSVDTRLNKLEDAIQLIFLRLNKPDVYQSMQEEE